MIDYFKLFSGKADKRMTEIAKENLPVLEEQGFSKYMKKLREKFQKERFYTKLLEAEKANI